MQITGYDLQNKLRALGFSREMLYAEFRESLWAFSDEDKREPKVISSQLAEIETNIADVQEIQTRYNLKVEITVMGDSMSLLAAVKRIGGAGRLGKMWRSAAKDQADRYGGYRERTRNKDEVSASRQISSPAAGEEAIKSSNYESALRAGIQTANSTEVEFEGFDLAAFG